MPNKEITIKGPIMPVNKPSKPDNKRRHNISLRKETWDCLESIQKRSDTIRSRSEAIERLVSLYKGKKESLCFTVDAELKRKLFMRCAMDNISVDELFDHFLKSVLDENTY